MKVNNSIFATIFFAVCNICAAVEIPTVLINNSEDSNDYYVGARKVSNAEYTQFLNSVATIDPNGLYNTAMGFVNGGIKRSGASGSYTYEATKPDMPVNYVSFWDAARFANWLTTGNTETGVYELTPTGITENTVTRNETVWENGGVAIASLHTELANLADFDLSKLVNLNQIDNIWEWDEKSTSSNRGLRRSGTFSLGIGSFIEIGTDLEDPDAGFRISSIDPIAFFVPEPSTYAAIFGCVGLAVVLICRRKGNKTL